MEYYDKFAVFFFIENLLQNGLRSAIVGLFCGVKRFRKVSEMNLVLNGL